MTDHKKFLEGLLVAEDKIRRPHKKNYLQDLIEKFRAPREQRLLEKSFVRIEKELDLQKILFRLRMLVYNALGTLSSNQSICVDRLSQIVVRETTDEEESDDDELNDMTRQNELLKAASIMQRSTLPSDKRIIHLFKLYTGDQDEMD